MIISAIGAIQRKDNGLGYKNKLLYHIKDDLIHFQKITKNKVIIMGRKTWESLPIQPLPNRINIVITKNDKLSVPEKVLIANSIQEALEIAKQYNVDEVLIIGGGEIYHQALPFCQRLYLTIVDGDKESDTFFPNYSEFTKIIEEKSHIDEKTNLTYKYITLEK